MIKQGKHLTGLSRCGFFICPPVDVIGPIQIPEGSEIIEILAGGTLYFEVNGRLKECPKGTVFWHIAGDHTICRTKAEDPYRCYVLHFLVKEKKRHIPRVIQREDRKEILEFASEVLHVYQNRDENFDEDLFANYVYSSLRWRCLMKKEESGQEYPAQLRQAVNYADSSFMRKEITASSIAEAAGMSRPYLFELFRKYIGKAPYQYILQKRIEKAQSMLMSCSLPIKDIAEKCGFESIEVFYRCFRRITGRTPADYRNRYSVYPK